MFNIVFDPNSHLIEELDKTFQWKKVWHSINTFSWKRYNFTNMKTIQLMTFLYGFSVSKEWFEPLRKHQPVDIHWKFWLGKFIDKINPLFFTSFYGYPVPSFSYIHSPGKCRNIYTIVIVKILPVTTINFLWDLHRCGWYW